MTIWNIFYGHLVIKWQFGVFSPTFGIFSPTFGIFSPAFGTVCQEKSGIPGRYNTKRLYRHFFAEDLQKFLASTLFAKAQFSPKHNFRQNTICKSC
jgi:hypothetical protein